MRNVNRVLLFLTIALAVLAAACGGGGSSTSTTTTTGGSGGGGGGSTVANSVTMMVDAGPAELLAANQEDEDLAFISVQICAPGSTTNCQTLDHVQVDTGSQGLRVASEIVNSTLMAALQQQTSGSNSVSECVSFGDMSFIWGPVMSGVDIHIGGEVAKNVPIQLTSSAVPPAAAANAGCPATQTGQIVTAADLGANAILGLGLFRQDCGGGCALSGSGNNGMY
ncbi:MAG: DUF3443 family protein, partial [Acidobacteria bacterium]|nr:DUF3443 family protein [Acidobacteriota bacterium]